jgi:NADPH-dependent 2,4-dienoyl-CoA reductase/sulfur reductase-like enzyme
MNYTRRTWLTAAGAVGFSAALTRCGGGDPLAPATTDAASAPLADTARSTRTAPTVVKSTTGRVVIVGGGMAGMAAAKYLRVWGGSGVQVTLLERNASYTSNILSNLVLTGQRTLSSLVYSYATAKQAYGIDIQQGDVTAIDSTNRTVTVAGRTTPLQYDRLIVAPGVVFDELPGLGTPEAKDRVVHAWQAGPETTKLRNQLVTMPDGGTFVLTIPKAPYRCPPGPYERACVVADWLMRNKPRSKVIVLDANPMPTAERHTFETAFYGIFANILTYVPNVSISSIDASGERVVVHAAVPNGPVDFVGDVVNAIPPQRAGKVVLENGLAAGGLWAPVKPATFESTVAAGVHVIGDSCSTASAELPAGVPKAGHIGNQEGKTAADAIIRAFRGLAPDTDVVINSACYSPITASTASWLTAVYLYDANAKGYRMVNAPASEATNPTADGYQDMNTWFNTLMGETFA